MANVLIVAAGLAALIGFAAAYLSRQQTTTATTAATDSAAAPRREDNDRELRKVYPSEAIRVTSNGQPLVDAAWTPRQQPQGREEYRRRPRYDREDEAERQQGQRYNGRGATGRSGHRVSNEGVSNEEIDDLLQEGGRR